MQTDRHCRWIATYKRIYGGDGGIVGVENQPQLGALIIFADGEQYVGKWADDRPNGQGTYTYADGRQYVGEFKDGLFHGQGTVTLTNGTQQAGEWQNGRYLR